MQGPWKWTMSATSIEDIESGIQRPLNCLEKTKRNASWKKSLRMHIYPTVTCFGLCSLGSCWLILKKNSARSRLGNKEEKLLRAHTPSTTMYSGHVSLWVGWCATWHCFEQYRTFRQRAQRFPPLLVQSGLPQELFDSSHCFNSADDVTL